MNWELPGFWKSFLVTVIAGATFMWGPAMLHKGCMIFERATGMFEPHAYDPRKPSTWSPDDIAKGKNR